MELESEYLLHLLGAYLREEKPQAQPNIDWETLMKLSQIHNVTGILSYMAYTHNLCGDARTVSGMRQICFRTMALFGQRAGLADMFCNHLAKNGIDHIRMKGHILRNYYPVPELRSFGDIDLVIRPEDRHKCHELILSLGFQIKTDWEPVYSYYRNHEYYEIHTELLEIDISDKANYRDYFRNMWHHTYSVGGHQYEFTPEFHFLYMIAHIAKHIHGSGAGIRMYLDVAAFIKHFGNSIDWNYIADELRTLHLIDFASTVWSAVESWFGVPSPVPVTKIPDQLLDEFTEYTLEAGVFGHHNRESALTYLKHNNQKNMVSRIHLLLKRAFPDVKTIKKRYTYLQKYPYLLPIAWIHRFFKTRNKFGIHTHEAEVILSAESSEIQRLQSIIKNIGL